MGKGDQRSRRGKIVKGTFGVLRPKKKAKIIAKKVAAPAKKKTTRKKKE